ncbi:EF-hand domain-containing protein [Streptomyces sulphureus]|uniref:EF-hand domain-containing protein n=1 Tax=Streptomyces sulphureus TaxID=47758 RepID=UPI00035E230A|nr:EF-hand domain-containing protein [Streptomyces sulphureus]
MVDMEAAARQVFDRYDLDGDGLLTAEEYRQVATELGDAGVTEDAAADLVATLDTDGDQRVSFAEFWAAIRP